ncbi:hypothetical protein MPH_00679 [Macrophomina phaseolina MS6]|uniref:Uncharacterized protein n=1 Tax=Macrophomina phaseolina (strain MS6) TaxID=1126212 RepID=K2SAR2_MACPH|nr:hypothetical protein MPH_00679 [Macrophomina phaseolina MS6]
MSVNQRDLRSDTEEAPTTDSTAHSQTRLSGGGWMARRRRREKKEKRGQPPCLPFRFFPVVCCLAPFPLPSVHNIHTYALLHTNVKPPVPLPPGVSDLVFVPPPCKPLPAKAPPSDPPTLFSSALLSSREKDLSHAPSAHLPEEVNVGDVCDIKEEQGGRAWLPGQPASQLLQGSAELGYTVGRKG